MDTLRPSVDRHTHLEGSLDPSWVRARAAERGLAPPEPLEALWRGDQVPFEKFIDAFFFQCRFLRNAEAAKGAVLAAVNRLPEDADGPRGIDLWVSPHFLVRQAKFITLDDLWTGMDEGIREAARMGVKIAVIVDAVNHFGIQHGHEVLDLILAERPEWLIGFSTGGLEGVPFREWAPVFERARAAGLRLAAHAGENGPASNVRDAVRDAGVERIVHGVRAIQDPALVDFLVEHRIPVDICPTSNRALVPELAPGNGTHPLPRFLAAGVRCALGTDDPGVIPTTLAGEWEAAKAMGLGDVELATLARNGREDAWCLGIGA
jgi:aminodeoxyfutalosine deaminase